MSGSLKASIYVYVYVYVYENIDLGPENAPPITCTCREQHIQGQGYSRSRGQGKVKLKKGFGRRDTYFWVNFSSRTRKMALEHFLNGRNREKMKIGKMQKSPEIG